MSLIRSRGNKSTEQAFVRMLRKHRVAGWRRHQVVRVTGADGASLKVRPDFVFVASRVAVFVDGCFWHGCQRHCRIPKTRRKYWRQKIHRNMKRDKLVSSALRKNGWTPIRFWEHDMQSPSVDRIIRILQGHLA
jgi:DNA mismatch endonuclease (patch repair protein)